MSFMRTLESIIRHRKANPVEGSYTNKLLSEGRARMAQKVGEEGVEIVVASLSQDRERQISETADLFYHTLVLLCELDITLDDVESELQRRHSPR